jgi:hypothetical protein
MYGFFRKIIIPTSTQVQQEATNEEAIQQSNIFRVNYCHLVEYVSRQAHQPSYLTSGAKVKQH